MCDYEIWSSLHDGRLRRDAAGPEDWKLLVMDGHGITEVRIIQIRDADLFRKSQMNRSPVDLGKQCRHFDCPNGIVWL